MAKQLVNPLERHVEKVVLAIAGLLLIGVLVKFVFSSPNKIDLGNEPSTPSTIDSRLAQKANETLTRIQSVKPPELTHDSKVDEFAASIEPIKAAELPVAASLSPEVPIVDAPDVARGLAKLVPPVAPPAPKFTMGRNTLILNTPQGDTRTPADWVMLAIPFDGKTQSDLQRRAWGATKADVILATPEVQRRMMHADGSWSDGDWQTITPWPSYKMPPVPTVRLVDQGGKVEANKEDQRAAEKYQEDLNQPSVQLAILRPMPPTFTKDENPWKFPLITTYEAVVKQDQEFLFPNDPSAALEDRYGIKQGDSAGKPKAEPKTAAQALSQELDDARAQMEQARKLWDYNEAMRAYNRAIEVFGNKDVTADLKTKAQKLMKEAETLAETIKRTPKAPSPAAPGKTAEAPKRDKIHQQDIWAYDAGAGSIENGRTYQYRMRARVLNRLAGHPESFENPLDAQTIIVAGEWSEPTEAIRIPEDSWFFVTREDKSKREVGVEFVRWYDGVWLKPKTSPKFNEGQALSFQDTIPVPDLEDRSATVNATVDFSEDLTLLDIDFARPIRERKSGSTAGILAVKFSQQPAPATAAVFVDGKGGLHERIVAVDRDDPLKRKIEIWSPSKRASAP